jgi:predicted nucleic acid-binding protein
VDANVLIAAFLKDSTVRRIITLSGAQLFVPQYVFEEFGRHRAALAEKAGLSDSAEEMLTLPSKNLLVVPEEEIRFHLSAAEEAMDPVDKRDAPYLATAMAVPCDGIWSDDPHFDEQTIVPVRTTGKVVAQLRKEGFLI